MRYKCPRCGEIFVGQLDKCPKCGRKFKYPENEVENDSISLDNDLKTLLGKKIDR